MSSESSLKVIQDTLPKETRLDADDADNTPVEAKLMANYACTYDEARRAGIAARQQLGLGLGGSSRDLEREASIQFEKLYEGSEPSTAISRSLPPESAHIIQQIIHTEEQIENIKKQLSEKRLLNKHDATDPESDEDSLPRTPAADADTLIIPPTPTRKRGGLFGCCSAAHEQVVVV